MKRLSQRAWIAGLPAVAGIWLLSAVGDRLWFWLDHSTPAWDQADYLTGCLNYWHALQQPHWFSRDWWVELWLLSSKVPPLTFIATAPFLTLFGAGEDQATLVNLLFSGILLASVYGVGTCLFSVQVGVWAAGLCVLFPAFYIARLDFLLDYPLAAMVALCFCCLTVWRSQVAQHVSGKESGTRSWKAWRSSYLTHPSLVWAIAFGVSFGLALLVKQTALFFLLVPLLWVGLSSLWQRAWGRLFHLGIALGITLLLMYPWYRTNWLLMLTSGKRATIDSAIAEGDPPLNTLDAWIFYLKDLTHIVSWLLVLVPVVGLILYWRRSRVQPAINNLGDRPRTREQRKATYQTVWASVRWLLVAWVGSYLLASLNVNKDSRYVMPYLPMLSVLLAYGLLLIPGRVIRWGTVLVATGFLLLNILPIPVESVPWLLSDRTRHPPFLGAEMPHAQVIAEVTKTEPYLQATLGVLPSTPAINQHNINFYGALRNFQAYGRQVGTQVEQVAEDARALSWFVTKSGDQGSIRHPEAQVALVNTVEQGGDFRLQKTWQLTDGELKLYHRRIPPIEVQPLVGDATPMNRVRLQQVIVPAQVTPGQPVPIVYRWTGGWEQLRSGVVLLNWQAQKTAICSALSTSNNCWLHDHGIGMGYLHSGFAPIAPTAPFQVIERTAMLPPATIVPGVYTLTAVYLNRVTGESYPIEGAPITLTLSAKAPVLPAPDLDLVTQLRLAAQALPQGLTGVEGVFARIGQINQYDPLQDYLIQAAKALKYRLQSEPQNSEFAYAYALAEVLQRRVESAIAALQQVVRIDPQNPYAYAYLAFVNLYDLRPHTAQVALDRALTLKPDSKELKQLSGVAALMQGHFIRAWQLLNA